MAAAVVAILGQRALAAGPDDLADELRPIRSKHADCPAVFGGIVDHGRLTAVGAVGRRAIDSPTPVTSADLIHLGSDTKAMTALLVGGLVQQHRLAWTDSVGELFPDLAAAMRPAARRITVADLLHHTAGLPHDLPWAQLGVGESLPDQRRSAVRAALSVEPTSPVGQYSYSNVGYVLLGAIIERKTNRPWERAIADDLFHPLGMTTAGFGPPSTGGRVDQAWGHVRRDGRLVAVQTDNPPVMAPAGEVHCSMADWAKFVALYCRGPGDGGPTLLDRATLATLTTPLPGQTYAGGWIVARRDWAGGPVLTHVGSNTTWTCVAWVAPDRGFAVLAATNAGGDDAAACCDDVSAALIRRHADGR